MHVCPPRSDIEWLTVPFQEHADAEAQHFPGQAHGASFSFIRVGLTA
jgi:hypothetical protein